MKIIKYFLNFEIQFYGEQFHVREFCTCTDLNIEAQVLKFIHDIGGALIVFLANLKAAHLKSVSFILKRGNCEPNASL